MTSVAVVPGPPAFTVNVKGSFVPAPRPVTVAVPCRTAVPSFTVTDVTLPVTYIAFTSKSPLSGLKLVATGGMSARHSKAPPCALAWKARTVVTGTSPGPPPSMMVFPPPATWWPPSFAAPALTGSAADAKRPSASRIPAHPPTRRNHRVIPRRDCLFERPSSATIPCSSPLADLHSGQPAAAVSLSCRVHHRLTTRRAYQETGTPSAHQSAARRERTLL